MGKVTLSPSNGIVPLNAAKFSFNYTCNCKLSCRHISTKNKNYKSNVPLMYAKLSADVIPIIQALSRSKYGISNGCDTRNAPFTFLSSIVGLKIVCGSVFHICCQNWTSNLSVSF